jgi:integrase
VRPRPVQDVRIGNLQDRRGHERTRKPWLVRWTVDREPFSRPYRTKAEADRLRSRLLVAQQDGDRFDRRTGEPESWTPAASELQVCAWARLWVAGEWHDWAPRTRTSAVEALCRFLPLVCDPKAPAPPRGLRSYLRRTLPPDATVNPGDECEHWLGRWGLTLGELNRELLADVERRLAVGDKGQPLAASTAGRYRKVAHTCVKRSVELGRLPADPWPPSPTGRSRRKARRKRSAVDIRRLPDPATMAAILQSLPTHQPGSRTYQAMTAVIYFAGLRPSEVVMLRPHALRLPDQGWGAIDVVEADIDWDEPGEPKTGNRTVPIPPELVVLLRTWIANRSLGPGDLLFRTRTGRRPTPSNWGRALKRACAKVGRQPMRVYDCRHACATAWLRAGVPLGEVARRLGHSVETLVSIYVGPLDGDDLAANKLIDAAMAEARVWLTGGAASTGPSPSTTSADA